MIIYIIIGIIIFICTNRSLVREGRYEYTVKNILRDPARVVGTIICVILWPVLVLWALYDGIKLYKDLRGS